MLLADPLLLARRLTPVMRFVSHDPARNDIGIMENKNGNYYNGFYRDYRVYIGMMEKKMETTTMGYIGRSFGGLKLFLN